MKAGQLRHVVTLQAPVETRDAVGQTVVSWVTLDNFRANVVNLAGREAVVARQVVATATDRVTLRHLGMSYPITPAHRFLFRGRILNVKHVDDVNNRLRQYDLLCEEVK